MNADRKIEALIGQIGSIDLIAQGTISKRTKVCGRANCKCATDSKARHGPYYEWTRREDGKYKHTVLPPEQAKEVERAIKNNRKLLKLLERWRKESKRVLKM
jgi:hypothetical protein